MEYRLVQPTDIRVGDTIGTNDPNHYPFVVKNVNGPQELRGHVQWTFDGIGLDGTARIANFRDGEQVRLYRRAEK